MYLVRCRVGCASQMEYFLPEMATDAKKCLECCDTDIHSIFPFHQWKLIVITLALLPHMCAMLPNTVHGCKCDASIYI